jgi:DmsE family decaheme c-type cytochrome
MSCVDCHNPHGSASPGRNLRFVAANEPSCFRCHTNLRGPFVFEHAPVKNEGCQTCHTPHGSVNPRMLTRQQVHYVCMECHTNASVPLRAGAAAGSRGTPVEAAGGMPPAFHNLNNPRYRNCTLCHIKVHGSYVDRNLER